MERNSNEPSPKLLLTCCSKVFSSTPAARLCSRNARFDEVGSSEAAFMKAAKAAMRSLLANKWVWVGGPETSGSLEPLA